MSTMSVREYLNENLKPKLPQEWLVIDYDKTLTNIGRVTAVYVHKTVEPAPEQGSLLHTVSLVVADPTQAEAAADERLDDHMEDLIPVIQAIPGILFQRAAKGMRDGFPCWDIELQIKTTS
ncbi:MAG: hypothetical protein J0H64_03740 [Actinobacteria bacterium]|nr:hypothetical protein [Actinomycetota bacterium]